MGLYANEITDGCGASTDVKGITRTDRRWKIDSDTDNWRPLAALSLVPVSIGNPHPDNSELLAKAKVFEPGASKMEGFVRVSYDSELTDSQDPSQPNLDPVDRVKWGYRGERFSDFRTQALNGEWLLNGAGDALEAVDVPFGGLNVSLTYYEPYDDLDIVMICETLFHVNDDFWGEYGEIEPGEAYMVDVNIPEEGVWLYGSRWRIITWLATVKLGGWNPFEFDNKGFNELKGGKKIPCMDLKGNKYSDPQFLNIVGGMLDANRDGNFVGEGDPFTLDFDMLPEASFPSG